MKSRFEQPRRAKAFWCRCRKCEHRHYFERAPRTYRRGLACASCGAYQPLREDGWRIDWYRTSRTEAARMGVCGCGSMPFPHRPGSSYYGVRCAPARGRHSHESRVAA